MEGNSRGGGQHQCQSGNSKDKIEKFVATFKC